MVLWYGMQGSFHYVAVHGFCVLRGRGGGRSAGSGGGGVALWSVSSPSARRQVVRELAALWLWGRVVGSRWPEDLGFNIAYNSFGGTVFAVDETIAAS